MVQSNTIWGVWTAVRCDLEGPDCSIIGLNASILGAGMSVFRVIYTTVSKDFRGWYLFFGVIYTTAPR